VPQGKHTVEIRFASTLMRSLGAGFSFAGVFVVCVLTLAGRRWRVRQGQTLGESAGTELTSRESFSLTEPGQTPVIHSESADVKLKAFEERRSSAKFEPLGCYSGCRRFNCGNAIR
jgi:hypothetical protein